MRFRFHLCGLGTNALTTFLCFGHYGGKYRLAMNNYKCIGYSPQSNPSQHNFGSRFIIGAKYSAPLLLLSTTEVKVKQSTLLLLQSTIAAKQSTLSLLLSTNQAKQSTLLLLLPTTQAKLSTHLLLLSTTEENSLYMEAELTTLNLVQGKIFILPKQISYRIKLL